MDAAALKAQQAPLKNAYRETPDKALITLRARGSIDDQAIACKVETGRAIAIAGLHPATGGSGMELCSGDMLLEALVACAGVTLKAVATALEFKLDGATVFGRRRPRLPRHAGRRQGCAGRLQGDPAVLRPRRRTSRRSRIDSLLKLTERYCVVFQTINQKPELSVTARRGGRIRVAGRDAADR